VNADPGWRAHGATIDRDALGFLLLRAAGPGPIELRYRGTTEQRVFAALSALAWVGGLLLLLKMRRP
jgi:hypothetical protein